MHLQSQLALVDMQLGIHQIAAVMPFYAPPAYRNATKVQNLLLDKMQDLEETGIALAQLARAWIETEHLKREMRGLPRLSAHSIRELAQVKKNRIKQVESSPASFEEIPDEPGKESISAATVPTPPAPEAPSALVVDNDK